jgi:hypothetical protein
VPVLLVAPSKMPRNASHIAAPSRAMISTAMAGSLQPSSSVV